MRSRPRQGRGQENQDLVRRHKLMCKRACQIDADSSLKLRGQCAAFQQSSSDHLLCFMNWYFPPWRDMTNDRSQHMRNSYGRRALQAMCRFLTSRSMKVMSRRHWSSAKTIVLGDHVRVCSPRCIFFELTSRVEDICRRASGIVS